MLFLFFVPSPAVGELFSISATPPISEKLASRLFRYELARWLPSSSSLNFNRYSIPAFSITSSAAWSRKLIAGFSIFSSSSSSSAGYNSA